MSKTIQWRVRLYVALAYLLLLTVFALLPAARLPFPVDAAGSMLYHFAAYGCFSWLMLASLGHCPLRWRSLYPWALVMVLAHVYWMEFFQGHIPGLQRQSSAVDLLAAMAGAIGGVVFRLRFAYQQCNCSLMGRSAWPEAESVMGKPAESGENESVSRPFPVTVADHPNLNEVIAMSFGWKALTLSPSPDLSISMVCTGKSMVSLPHLSYGSISGRASSNLNMQSLLAQYALPRNIAQLEFRQALSDHHPPTLKTASWLSLSTQMDAQLRRFSPNLRRKISKGRRNGFIVQQGGAELLHDFWLVYARHLDKLGSVALPERFFANLLKGYTNGHASVFLLRHNNSLVGGAFNLAYQGFYENGWFATLHKHQKHYASYVLHHAMIEHAIHLHCHTYSFGRSTTGSGVHRFKQQWGARDIPLLWSQFPAQKVNLRKHHWLSRFWNLLPWTCRKYGGRYLAKWIY